MKNAEKVASNELKNQSKNKKLREKATNCVLS